MTLKINYDDLTQAMETRDPLGVHRSYFDTQTGDVLLIGDWVEGQARMAGDPDELDIPDMRLAWYLLWNDGEIEAAWPEVEAADREQQAEAYLKRFLLIPTTPSYKGYQDMVDFVDTVPHAHLRDQLDVALDGKGAFRRFKNVLLRYPHERERWFAFSDQRQRERADAWLREQGVKN